VDAAAARASGDQYSLPAELESSLGPIIAGSALIQIVWIRRPEAVGGARRSHRAVAGQPAERGSLLDREQ
jgi:hypothetical protein